MDRLDRSAASRVSCSPISLVRNIVLAAAFLLGWLTLSRQFGRRSRITHCPAKLEASGVHVGTHGPIQVENAARQEAYDRMHASLHDKGLQLGNKVTQGLSMDDLFQVRDGVVEPQHHTLDKPVRAIVAPIIDDTAAKRMQEVFERFVGPLVSPIGMWPQNSNLYHVTVWHASPHQHPVAATKEELDEEVRAVQEAVGELCPMHITLERIIVNSAGVIMACWQLSRGTSTASLRHSIKAALPNAPPPSQQTVQDVALWYTTLGRLLDHPEKLRKGPGLPEALDAVAQDMTEELCGLQTRIDRVWYIQEYEKLALALSGRWDMQEAHMSESECF